jgi:large-conductance mechanosensitive channel
MLLNITTVIAMIVIGWVVWITVQRREKSDQSFQEKLDRDDERARKGREAEAAYRQAQRDRE